MIDIAQVRADTPGCEHVIHFNNAGAALMPGPVYATMTGYLHDELLYGGYETHTRRQADIDHTYDALAALIGAQPDEIAVVEHATRAWNLIFYALDFHAGDRIVTAPVVYASNYIAFLQMQQRVDVEIVIAPTDDHGQIDVAQFDSLMDERVKLVALDHVPTNGGLINPAAEVGRIVAGYPALYLLDACQSTGQLPLDVDMLHVDFMVGTGRKFLRGPRGTGYLYCRRTHFDWLEPPVLDLRAATWTAPDSYTIAPTARCFEQWESNRAGHVALGDAADYAMQVGLDAIHAYTVELAANLRERLREVPGVTVADQGEKLCAITTFYMDDHPAAAIKEALITQGINVSVIDQHSALLDMQSRDLPPLVRASVHYYNTEDEIERFISALHHLA